MGANRHITWLALVLASCSLAAPSPINAQDLSSSDNTTISQPATETVTDVIVGKGTRGPYKLSWKNIEPGSVTIVISGDQFLNGEDYAVDPASGTVGFNEPLQTDAIARVTYIYVTGKAVQNDGTMSLPVNLALVGGERGNLSFTGVYKADGSNAPSLGVVGLSAGLKIGQTSDVSSTFMISQADTGEKSGLSDRSAMKFAAGTSVGAVQFKGSFSRAGEQFASAQDYGLSTGKQAIDLAAVFGTANGPVSGSLSYDKKDDLAQAGASQTTNEQKVVVCVANAPKLSISRAETQCVQADKTKTSVNTNTIQLDQAFGQTTASAVMQDTQNTLSDGNRYNTRMMGMSLQSSAVDGVQISGKFTTQNSNATGDATAVDIGVKAGQANRFSFAASHSSSVSDQNGQLTMTGFKMAACPIDQLDFSADVSLLDAADGGSTSTAFRVAAKPIDAMKVEGTYSGKQVAQGDNQLQRGLRVEAKPVGFLKLSAGVGETQTGVQLSTSRDAGVEIGAGSFINLKSNIHQSTDGSTGTIVTDCSGAIKPVNGVEVSGAYKDRLSTVDDELETKMLSVALGQPEALRLTGQYLYNPEDTQGIVERSLSQGLGLEIGLGDLGLSGTVRQKDEYLIGKQSLEKEFQLKLALFTYGSLTTGLKIAQDMALSQDSLTTYSVGYTHVLGSNFNLALLGELVRTQHQDLLLDDEYKATAKVGMSF